MNDIIKKNGVTFGIALGLILIVEAVVFYTVNLKLFVNIGLAIALFVVNLILCILCVAKTKKDVGGFITFKEAFTAFFITIALATFISNVFYFLLFNVIDPEAQETLKTYYIEMSVNMGKSLGTPVQDIKTGVEQIKNNNLYSAASMVKSYVGLLLFYSVIGLIVAAIFKNKAKDAYQ